VIGKWRATAWVLHALLVVVLLSQTESAAAQPLTPEDVERLEAPESPYKITPEMEAKVRALFKPYDLDAALPGGYLLDEIGLEKNYVRVGLLAGNRKFSLYLLPPVVSAEAAASTPSFRLVTEGEANAESTAALIAAVAKNDDGKFWPEAPTVAAGEGRKIPPSVRKVHFSQLIGDFFVILLLVLLGVALPGFRKALAGRPLAWWWLLAGVTAAAAAARVVALLAGLEAQHPAAWTASSELPHVSIAWYLNLLGRFSVVTLTSISILNVVGGVLTVAGIYVAVSCLSEGLLPPFVAALFVAASPAHVALSASVAATVPLLAFLVWMFACKLLFLRRMDIRMHLLASGLCLFALFARPEAIVFVIPLILFPLAKVERKQWLKPALWIPCLVELGLVAVRAATLPGGPDYPDRFLSCDVALEAFLSNASVWLVGFSRVSFGAMLLWILGLVGQPWKRDLPATIAMALLFLLGLAVYYHVDLSESFQGGRVSLIFLLPLAFLTGEGARYLANLNHPRRGWAVAFLILWLLAGPLIHAKAVAQDYKAVYDTNFMIEA
jgi:hypothetical protein